jgi:hypothetical protein
MRPHGDRITIIRHMVLLSAGVFTGCAWSWRGETTLPNRKSRIMRRRAATQNVRANAPVTDFGYVRIRSILLFPVTIMLFSMILMR